MQQQARSIQSNIPNILVQNLMGVIHSTKIQTGPTGKSGPPQKMD